MDLNLYTCESDLNRFLRENRVVGMQNAVTCSEKFNRISRFKPDYPLTAVTEAMEITTYPIHNVCISTHTTNPEPGFTTRLFGKAILDGLALLKHAKMTALNDTWGSGTRMVPDAKKCATAQILNKIGDRINTCISNRCMKQEDLDDVLKGYEAFYNVEQTPILSNSILWTGLDQIRKVNRLRPFNDIQCQLSSECGDIPADKVIESYEYVSNLDEMKPVIDETLAYYENMNQFMSDGMPLKSIVVGEKFDSLTYDEILDRIIIDAQTMVEKSAVPVDVDSVTFNVSESHSGQLDELRLNGCKFFKMINPYHGDRIVIESEGTPYLLFAIEGHNPLFGYDIDNGTKLMRISDTEHVNESVLDISTNIFGGTD